MSERDERHQYGIFTKRTSGGKSRYYRFDSRFRLRLMGAESARLAVETCQAVFLYEVPFSASSPNGWVVESAAR